MFSNNATLAGHVEIGDYVILGGFAGVHQFCRIGAHAFIGMGCLVNGDVPPFVMVGRPTTAARAASTAKASSAAASMPSASPRSSAPTARCTSPACRWPKRARSSRAGGDSEDVRRMLDFIERSERALVR